MKRNIPTTTKEAIHRERNRFEEWRVLAVEDRLILYLNAEVDRNLRII